MLREISKEELEKILKERTIAEELDLHEVRLQDMELSGWDLHNINFDKSDFCRVKFDGANMSYIKARNSFFGGSSLRGANLSGAILQTADLRGCDLCGANLCGADMFAAALEGANLRNIRTDEKTKFFRPYCPKTGPFVAWKVCFNRRIVQLLVPEDALRVSATTNEVRCDKAKVLSIRSVDYKESYEEARSYVDEEFVYRKGEMVYANNFNPNRFIDSGGGIHVWMTREEAVAYMG